MPVLIEKKSSNTHLFDDAQVMFFAAKKALVGSDVSKLASYVEELSIIARTNNGMARNSREFDRMLLDVADVLARDKKYRADAEKLYKIVAEDSPERASSAYKRRANDGLARAALMPKP